MGSLTLCQNTSSGLQSSILHAHATARGLRTKHTTWLMSRTTVATYASTFGTKWLHKSNSSTPSCTSFVEAAGGLDAGQRRAEILLSPCMCSKVSTLSALSVLSKNRDDTKQRSNMTKCTVFSVPYAPLYLKPARATAKMPVDVFVNLSMKQQLSLCVSSSMQL